MALGYVHGMVNRVDDLGIDSASIAEASKAIQELLGIKLAEKGDITDDQKALIREREAAREAKDWAKSDEIRDTLLEQGIALRDTAGGSIWDRA